jgi:microcystin-dependent protein
VSDKCVKYTGLDVAVLGIQNGDSLSFVEQAIVTFLTSTLDGTGIKPTIDPQIICTLVQQYLPTCADITIVDVVTALIKAACDLQTQVTDNTDDIAAINVILAALNADYNVSCLAGVISSSDTHEVVQATIDKLCSHIVYANATFVKNSDLCTLVKACTSGETGKAKDKMVPYTIVEYYGPLTNYPFAGDSFTGTGAGQGYWEKVYICNGENGTPDKRGRVSVGTTDGSSMGLTLPIVVNPVSSPFNPSYQKGVPEDGANSIALIQSQMPGHTHAATSVVTEPNQGQGHRHDFVTFNNQDRSLESGGDFAVVNVDSTKTYQTAYAVSGVTVTTTNDPVGGNQPFSIIQPGIGCIYIMYIP